MTDDITRPIEIEAPGAAADPATEAAGTEPVVTAASAGPNRLRWAVGLGVAGVAAVVAIAAFMLLGSKPAPEALKYIPADSVMVVEIRPDLPGDQLQKLGNLLAHFPGFKDQSTLPDKLDETLSRLVGQATQGGADYRADLKPWLSGPAFFAMPATAVSGTEPTSFSRGVLSLTTTGTVTCDKPLKDLAVTHETYKGLDLAIASERNTACVFDGRQALLGDPVSIRAAIDAHGGGTGLDKSASYQKARASLQGDQLFTLYIDGKGYLSMFSNMLENMSGMPGMASGFMPGMPMTFPEWLMEGLRAEDDAIVLDAFTAAPLPASAGSSPLPSLLPLPAAHASVFTPLAPANTLFFVEFQGAGVGLQNALTTLQAIPDLGPALQMLNGAGAGAFLGSLEDVGVMAINGADGPSGGLMLAAKDEATAGQQASSLLGLIALAGFGNNNVTTSESTIGGVTVTTVTISDIGSLVPPGQLPSGVQVPADATISFSVAAKGKVLLLGSGESFMHAVLEVQPGQGLVDQDLYKRATSRALPGSQLTMYVGIRDIVALAEKSVSGDELARWQSDLKPYFAPFEAISLTSSSTTDGGGHARISLSVGNP
jgi:Protein of unknown function (DUF3352)